jgi:TrmH family RNA methyltransferase
MPLTKTEFKHIQQLLTKKGRKEQQRFLVSGIRLLEDALRHRFRPELVLFAPDELSDRGKTLVKSFQSQKIKVEQISSRDLRQLADTVTPQGLAAVFTSPNHSLKELSSAPPRTMLVCENLSDPGNVRTLFRSALAFGCDTILTLGTTCEPYSPKVVRSSAGAVFGLTIIPVSMHELFLWRDKSNALILAGDINGKAMNKSLFTQFGNRPVLVCVGSEADGLSAELKQKADYLVKIVHEPTVESLNAAMAGTILLHDLYETKR